MSKLALRAALLSALLISLAIKHRSIAARDDRSAAFDASLAITDVIQSYGLNVLENPVKPPKMLAKVVYFQRANCSRQSLVMPLTFNLEAAPLLARVAPQDYRRVYVYADISTPDQDRVAFYIEWLKHYVLALTGGTRYIPVKIAIVVAEPAECAATPTIDWRTVWDRERHAKQSGSSAPDETSEGGAP